VQHCYTSSPPFKPPPSHLPILLQNSRLLPPARPPIHKQILSRNPPTGLTRQPKRRALQFLRLSNPPKQRLLLKLPHQIRLLRLQPAHHVRHHVARAQAVDADAVRGEFHGQGLDETAHGGFGGGVAGDLLRDGGDVRGDGGDEDYAAVCGGVRLGTRGGGAGRVVAVGPVGGRYAGGCGGGAVELADHGVGAGLGD